MKLQNKLLWRIPYNELRDLGWTVIGREKLHDIPALMKEVSCINPSAIFLWFQRSLHSHKMPFMLSGY